MKSINELTRQDMLPIRYLFRDFDGVLTNKQVYVTEHGYESVCCSRLDGMGLGRIKELGIIPHVISTEKNDVIQRRCEKLRVSPHNNVKNKPAVKEEVLSQRNLSYDNTMFLGNDINDLPALRVAAIPACVQDRVPNIDPVVHFITDQNGGQGAVREICDKIVSLREL